MIWIVRLLAAFGLGVLVDAISEQVPRNWREKCAITFCSFVLAALMFSVLALIAWVLSR